MQLTYKVGDTITINKTYNHRDIIHGKTYKVTKSFMGSYGKTPYISIRDENNDIHNIAAADVQFVDMTKASIPEQYAYAVSLIGQRAKFHSETFTIDSVSIAHKGSWNGSTSVGDELANNEKCVAIHWGYSRCVPLSRITVLPKSHELKISDDYTATVTKEHVIVGCQTIPIEIVRELVKLSDSL